MDGEIAKEYKELCQIRDEHEILQRQQIEADLIDKQTQKNMITSIVILFVLHALTLIICISLIIKAVAVSISVCHIF